MLSKVTRNLPYGLAALLLTAVSVSAQDVTGTIEVTGSVAAKCFVIPGNASTFGTTFALGELSLADGTVNTTITDTESFRVHCNTGNPEVTLTADELVNSASATAGYSNIVHYKATLDVDLADGTTDSFDYETNSGTGTATTATALNGPIRNAADNVTVSLEGLNTPNATDLLVAGNYTGEIVVTIEPGV